MLQLPNEMIMHIFEYVPDKMNIDSTCKRFKPLLIDLLKSNDKNYNDPYCLRHYFNKDNIVEAFDDDSDTEQSEEEYVLALNITEISNHHCLNYILKILCDHFKIIIGPTRDILKDRIGSKIMMPLIYQNCAVDNVSKPSYFKELMYQVSYLPIHRFACHALKYQSYCVLKMMLTRYPDLNWINVVFNTYNDISMHMVIKEINFVIQYKLQSYAQLYKDVYNLLYVSIKYDLLNYLEQFLDKDIINYLQ